MTSTYNILSSDGEIAGQAPGKTPGEALGNFNRDALEGLGEIAWNGNAVELNWRGDSFIAEPETDEAELSLHELEAERASLREIIRGKVTAATKDALQARVDELEELAREAIRIELDSPARITPTPGALQHIEERLEEEGLPGFEIEDGPTRKVVDQMWMHARMGLEATEDDETRVTARRVAHRIVGAWLSLYMPADHDDAELLDRQPTAEGC